MTAPTMGLGAAWQIPFQPGCMQRRIYFPSIVIFFVFIVPFATMHPVYVHIKRAESPFMRRKRLQPWQSGYLRIILHLSTLRRLYTGKDTCMNFSTKSGRNWRIFFGANLEPLQYILQSLLFVECLFHVEQRGADSSSGSRRAGGMDCLRLSGGRSGAYFGYWHRKRLPFPCHWRSCCRKRRFLRAMCRLRLCALRL